MSDAKPRSIPDPGEGRNRLAVERLTLSDFRCYAFQRFETGGDPVVLTGPNGAGKTNVLEALSFLVPGRGLRRVPLNEPSRVGGKGNWAVAAHLQTPVGGVDVGTGLETSTEGREKRLVRIDGEPARNQSALAEVVNAVWLTPQMDRLFQDGPGARRRFLDRLVFGFDPAHSGRLTGYDHALRERGKLLRDSLDSGRRPDEAWLAGLEETMAARAVAIVAARKDMVERLNDACALASGPFPRAGLSLNGTLEDWLGNAPALDVEERLRQTLVGSRPTDGERGGAPVGPHRSDLEVRHGIKDLPAHLCSTGEQKALLIAIILADARMRAFERDAAPLVLLDEVGAHLDEERREALFEELFGLGAQAWMTGTDPALFAPLRGRARFFHVEDGVAAPKD
ncbi:DNA replication/repair protein RecF [Magnetospira sp. QH-2]|uniref:DNA replication/repair protein RecF n=1 Tax=Magnetospira sp. (strain QH-2) TaxID=1288970 RepID=UPI0005FA49F6|nr:DNA replication/repair protein RecF [Magnetospira sp. QH-2]